MFYPTMPFPNQLQQGMDPNMLRPPNIPMDPLLFQQSQFLNAMPGEELLQALRDLQSDQLSALSFLDAFS
jgi:hypothetical protein